MLRKFLIGTLFVATVGGAFAGGKLSDLDKLTRVGHTVADKLKDAMPETARVAGPIVAIKTGEWMSVDERVRVRLRTEKSLEGANILVIADGNTVRLRGEVAGAHQTVRAIELAQSTTGVDKVVSEIGVVESR